MITFEQGLKMLAISEAQSKRIEALETKVATLSAHVVKLIEGRRNGNG